PTRPNSWPTCVLSARRWRFTPRRSGTNWPNANGPGTWDATLGGRALIELATNYTSPRVFHCPSDSDAEPTAITTSDYFVENSVHTSYEFFSIWWAGKYGTMLVDVKGQVPQAWDLVGGGPDTCPL